MDEREMLINLGFKPEVADKLIEIDQEFEELKKELDKKE